MIVHPSGAQLELVTQPDHARFAAELLALWRADGLPSHPRRDDLLAAVREHDNGWREADAAPRASPADGRPLGFMTFPAAERRELWLRGIDRFAASRPYVALLTAEHALHLHRRHAGNGDWDGFLDQAGERREELAGRVDLSEPDLAADYAWLELADLISLVGCGARSAIEHRGRRAVRVGSELRLDPFPLAGSTTFTLPLRRIADRVYGGDADLGGELAAARWRDEPLRVVPGSEP